MLFLDNWIEYSSYLASVLVFVAFFMKSIVPLRLIAMASNIAFVSYAAGAGIMPILILHGALLPLNVVRIVQHLKLVRRVRDAAENVGQTSRLRVASHFGRRSGGEQARMPLSPNTITSRTCSIVSPTSATRRERPTSNGREPSTSARTHSAPARVLPAPRPPMTTHVRQSPSGGS